MYKVKWSRYRPGVAQRVGRGIAVLFHDRGTRRGWVVGSTPRPHFTPGKDPVPILQEADWAPGPVWTGGNSRPHRDSIPDRPAHNQSLYRLSYRAHNFKIYLKHVRWKIVDRIYFAVCWDRWWAFVCAGMNLVLSKKGGRFLIGWVSVPFSVSLFHGICDL